MNLKGRVFVVTRIGEIRIMTSKFPLQVACFVFLQVLSLSRPRQNRKLRRPETDFSCPDCYCRWFCAILEYECRVHHIGLFSSLNRKVGE